MKSVRCISLAKVKGSNEILGGYNPIEWKSVKCGKFSTTKDSFIFSSENSYFLHHLDSVN